MTRQDFLSIAFLFAFILFGALTLYLLPERGHRNEWKKQTARAIPPAAGKTEQFADQAPAKDHGGTPSLDKKRPDEEGLLASNAPVKARSQRMEAIPGASGWLTEEERKLAHGKIWPVDAKGFQTALSEHKEHVRKCYITWQNGGTAPPSLFSFQFKLETLFGEPYATIRQVTIPELSSEKKSMETCVHKSLMGVLFKPPPGDKMTVNFPINFTSLVVP